MKRIISIVLIIAFMGSDPKICIAPAGSEPANSALRPAATAVAKNGLRPAEDISPSDLPSDLSSGRLPPFKRENEKPAESPFILKERMQDTLFVKGDKEILFPAEILTKLYDMTRISRQLRIEQHAAVGIKNGKAVEIDYVDDSNKIAVIYADLPAGTIMNPFNSEDPKSFYFVETNISFGALLRWTIDIKEKSDISKPELQARFSEAIQGIKKTFSFYRTRVSFYSRSEGKRVDINSQNVDALNNLTEEELFNLASDLTNIELIGTEWIAPYQRVFRERKKDLEYADFHSHPIGYACPPSAIRIGNQRIGDIYGAGFFEGEVNGLILDTEDGDELFLLYEPDRRNEQNYLDMFDKFWQQRRSILEDLRRVSMAPINPSSANPGKANPNNPGEANSGNPNHANPGKAKKRTRAELYPGEAVDKKHFEDLDEIIFEIDTLRQKRMQAKEFRRDDKRKAAEKRLRTISRRLSRKIDGFPRSIAGLTFRIEAKRLLRKAVSLILANNEPAAHLTLMAAKRRIASERTILLKKRLRFKPEESISEDENENIIIRMQRFVSEAGTSILKRKKLKPFARITKAFRTLDNAIDSEVADRSKMEEFLETLQQCRVQIRVLQTEKDIDSTERQMIIKEVIDNIDMLKRELKWARLSEKKAARRRLLSTIEVLQIFDIESNKKQFQESDVKKLLESVQWYLREANSKLTDRAIRVDYIIDSLQQVYVAGLRDILRKRNRAVLAQIDTILGLLKQSQYGDISRDWLPNLLNMKYVRLEPGLRQVRFYLKGGLKAVKGILQKSNRPEIETLKTVAEANLKKAKARMNEVRVIATVVAGYRDLLKDTRLKLIKGLDTPDDVFERVYQQNLRYLDYMRGTPTLKRLKLYQACRIPVRITEPVTRERIDNPVYLAVSALIDEVDAEDFQGKTTKEAKAFIKTLCESHRITLDRLTTEAKISLADIGRILTLNEEEYDKTGEILISLQAAINTLKKRGYKAGSRILRAKRNKVARDLKAVGLIQESKEIGRVITVLGQIAELAKRERALKQKIERQPELEERESLIKEKLSNNPLYHKGLIQNALVSSKETLAELRKQPEILRRWNIVKEIDGVINALNYRDILTSEGAVGNAIRKLKIMLGPTFPKKSPEVWVKEARGKTYRTIRKLKSILPSIERRNEIIKEQGLEKRDREDPVFARYRQECEELPAELSSLREEIRREKQMLRKRKARLGKTEPELEVLKARIRSLFDEAIATLGSIEKNLRAKYGLDAGNPTTEIEADLLKIMGKRREGAPLVEKDAGHLLLIEQAA